MKSGKSNSSTKKYTAYQIHGVEDKSYGIIKKIGISPSKNCNVFLRTVNLKDKGSNIKIDVYICGFTKNNIIKNTNNIPLTRLSKSHSDRMSTSPKASYKIPIIKMTISKNDEYMCNIWYQFESKELSKITNDNFDEYLNTNIDGHFSVDCYSDNGKTGATLYESENGKFDSINLVIPLMIEIIKRHIVKALRDKLLFT
uniref:Uncharacterized protein n=1 Tax=Mimivirus LCMiAC02 TaxID=2506609 RepID=A0A4P6VP70_9VIRU|nr:MAG: hypothetical protein LCMiAC02_04740 [Mimivirus LCMiAC02]